MYLRCCLDVHIRDSLKLHICHYTHIDHKRCKFGCELSISKCPLLAEPCATSAVSPFLYYYYPNSVYLHKTVIFLKVCKFGCYRSVIYVSLFEEPCAFRVIHRIVLVGFVYILVHRIVKRFATVAACLISMCQ